MTRAGAGSAQVSEARCRREVSSAAKPGGEKPGRQGDAGNPGGGDLGGGDSGSGEPDSKEPGSRPKSGTKSEVGKCFFAAFGPSVFYNSTRPGVSCSNQRTRYFFRWLCLPAYLPTSLFVPKSYTMSGMDIFIGYQSALDYWRLHGPSFLRGHQARRTATHRARKVLARAEKPVLAEGNRRPAGCSFPLRVLVGSRQTRTTTACIVSHT